jgi:ribonuclease HI
MHGTLYFDGGARPKNPGHAAFACVVTVEKRHDQMSRYIGYRTNNEAEYFGLIVGMKFAYDLGVKSIDIYSDSKLVVNQVLGEWQVKQETLRPLVKDARDLLQTLYGEDASLNWVKRLDNTVADQLCTAAINYGRNLNPFLPQSIKDARPGHQIDPFQSQCPPSRRYSGRVRHPGLSSLMASLNM